MHAGAGADEQVGASSSDGGAAQPSTAVARVAIGLNGAQEAHHVLESLRDRRIQRESAALVSPCVRLEEQGSSQVPEEEKKSDGLEILETLPGTIPAKCGSISNGWMPL